LLAESRAQELLNLQNSRSWRYTSVFRKGSYLIYVAKKRTIESANSIKNSISNFFILIVKKAAIKIYHYPQLDLALRKILNRMPLSKKYLKRIMMTNIYIGIEAEMSESAQCIYAEIKASLIKRQ
jgi:hypothetical protein